jgi:D-alanine-D-alanine ligase
MRIAFLYNEPSEDPAGLAEDSVPDHSPVVAALRQLGHDIAPIACSLNLAAVRRQLDQLEPEVVFNRVESLGGSDALVASLLVLLDTMRIPYTGCPTQPYLATTSKLAVKERLANAGLPTPAWILADGRSNCGLRHPKGTRDCGLKSRSFNPRSEIRNPKLILKSVYEHASFAMDDSSVVRPLDMEQVFHLIRDCEARFERPYFAEEFIDGREFNLALLGDEPTVLPPAEIDFSAFPRGKPRIVGHNAKFAAGSFEFDNTPRRFDFPASHRPLLAELTRLAADCWRLFGLRGYARVDFRCDEEGRPWILEINANPCLSPDSGFAAALAEAGINYTQGIERVLLDAVERGRANARIPRSSESLHEHLLPL